MPKIPTTVSSGSILGAGQQSTSVPSGAFQNTSLQPLAEGAFAISDGIGVYKRLRKEIEEKEKEKQDNMWLSQATSEYSRQVTDFEVDPNNRNRTDYTPAFLQNAEDIALPIIEGAPSAEAHQAFEETRRNIVDSRYPRTAQLGAENELKHEVNLLEGVWMNYRQGYESYKAVDPAGASDDFQNGLVEVTNTIRSMYGEIAPEIARKLITEKVEEAIIALSDTQPEISRQIMKDNAYFLPADRQKVLTGILDAKKEERGLLLKEDFDLSREKLINSSTQQPQEPFPLEDYQRIYPGEKGQLHKMRDDAKLLAANSAHSFVKSLEGMNPLQQAAKAEEWSKTLTLDDELRAASAIVQPYVAEQVRDFQTDPTQWLRNNNKSLRLIEKELTSLEENAGATGTDTDGNPGVLPLRNGQKVATPDDVAETKTRLYNATLRYQGAPEEGQDADNFMSLPPNQRHLLTREQADRYSAIINSSEVDSVVGVIKSIIEEYPTEELQYQVIKDLATLPKEKINPIFQLAFENHNQTWLPKFINNVRNIEDLEKVNDVDKKKVSAAITANSIWASYSKGMNSPEDGRIDQIKGFRDAIDVNARAMVAQGLKPKEAVDESIKQLLLSTASPVEMPIAARHDTSGMKVSIGEPSWKIPDRPQLWIPTTPRGFKSPLSQEAKENYARRMGTALANIHPDDVDFGQFGTVGRLEDKETRRKTIHEHIIRTGQYYPEPGGAEYIVTVEGATKGTRTALRHKDGSFFKLPLRSVPTYTKNSIFGSAKVKGLTPDTWEWKPTNTDADYPIDDIGKDGYPRTGSFWQYKK